MTVDSEKFTIKDYSVAITLPNSASLWKGGETVTIRWRTSAVPAGKRIRLELREKQTIGTKKLLSIGEADASALSFQFQLPRGVASIFDAFVKIEFVDDSDNTATSPNFVIADNAQCDDETIAALFSSAVRPFPSSSFI